ncbi:hypothetical protein D0Z07_3433 [Hyphodiscus hymeniophilus]|uniref:Apple domain-containing protein n=1 Tax=Hyphodiscus hymeniophilus TaxID=353542 RepID=A0A9P6VMN3_9HELO|nr:hypothetical protein D0Z07_3433 [Hyphodiscus hymeniophilus]
MLRPQRISSEAPEVVSQQQDLLSPVSPADTFHRRYDQQMADPQSPEHGPFYETPDSVSSPHEANRDYQTPGRLYNVPSYGVEVLAESTHQGQRVCGFVATVILIIVAFIIGGGVGGGIGGAIAVSNKHKASSSSPSSSAAVPTSSTTSSAPPSTTTIVIDQAGCPIINNATYNSTVTPYTFVQACSTEIQADSGQSIEVANQTESSFDACLDWCAQYTANSTTKGQCIAATWVIFSAVDPSRNSKCYLKNSTGVAIPASSGQQFVSGYLNNA